MAIYHASTKPISRGKGRSATAAAAYRSGELILDKRTGLTHDYRKKNGVEHQQILTPDQTVISRETLWNLAEAAEKRKDARVAREWEIALPSELSQEARIALAIQFGSALCQRYQVAVDVCVHEPGSEGDERNYHAHLLMTTREFKNGGLGDKAKSELDNKQRQALGLARSQDDISAIRALWAEHANMALEQAQIQARIDHRSYAEQGLEEIPTIKMGKTATQMERMGISTEKGNINRHTVALNGEIRVLRAEQVDLTIQKENVAKNVEKMLASGIDEAWAKFEAYQQRKATERELEQKRLQQEKLLKQKDGLEPEYKVGRGFSL